jgi:hypothetical protein
MSNKEFCAAITENNPFNTYPDPEANRVRICKLSENCYQKSKTYPNEMTAAEVLECDEQICEKVGWNLGPYGVEIVEAQTFGFTMLDWSGMFKVHFPNVLKDAAIVENHIYDNLYIKVYGEELGNHYQELLDEGVFISILAGGYDGCCSPRSIEAFIREQTYWRDNWNSAPWTVTAIGKSKTWDEKSEFEIVDKCPHGVITCEHAGENPVNGKDLTLSKLKRLTSSEFYLF